MVLSLQKSSVLALGRSRYDVFVFFLGPDSGQNKVGESKGPEKERPNSGSPSKCLRYCLTWKMRAGSSRS